MSAASFAFASSSSVISLVQVLSSCLPSIKSAFLSCASFQCLGSALTQAAAPMHLFRLKRIVYVIISRGFPVRVFRA